MSNITDQSWRCSKSAKHLLAAVVFNESSRAAKDRAGVYLLPHIGHYYSAFHLSLASIVLLTNITRPQIARVSHKNLRKLIMSQLVQPRRVKKRFYDTYEALREIREEANYQIPLVSALRDKLSNPYDAVENMFTMAIPHIKRNADLVPGGSFMQIQTWIGDGFGDDMSDEYCSRRLHKLIVQRCLAYGITT